MRVVLDGKSIRTESDLHDVLARELDFGPYYGRNLDALWDRLYRDVERPVELIWKDSAESKAHLGQDAFERISSLLIEVMRTDESHPPDERFVVRFE